jgi:hypothetical protein
MVASKGDIGSNKQLLHNLQGHRASSKHCRKASQLKSRMTKCNSCHITVDNPQIRNAVTMRTNGIWAVLHFSISKIGYYYKLSRWLSISKFTFVRIRITALRYTRHSGVITISFERFLQSVTVRQDNKLDEILRNSVLR